ncbi:MAG: hypothetical protein HQL67_03740 [Magnetococcales bacterium]|nr:hypothetical protein [Magnetococcales bacterium]
MNSHPPSSTACFNQLNPSSAAMVSRFSTAGKKSGIRAILAVGYLAMAVVVNETAGATGLLAMGFLMLTTAYVLGRAELLRKDRMLQGARLSS